MAKQINPDGTFTLSNTFTEGMTLIELVTGTTYTLRAITYTGDCLLENSDGETRAHSLTAIDAALDAGILAELQPIDTAAEEEPAAAPAETGPSAAEDIATLNRAIAILEQRIERAKETNCRDTSKACRIAQEQLARARGNLTAGKRP